MHNKLNWLLGWMMAVFGVAHVAAAADTALPELWTRQVGNIIDSSPAIADNGTLYITCSGYTNFKDFSSGKLVALSPDGKTKWQFNTFGDIKSSPAIADDGTIYFGCRDRKFYAIAPNGKPKWHFATQAWIDSSAAIATNGTVYFGSWDKKFYALNPDGSKKWEFATDGPIDSSPAIGTDGTVYFGSHDKNFYALNANGSTNWIFATAGAIVSSPALNCDGTIYFTSVDGNLYVLNSNGTKKWQLKTGGVRESSPVIDGVGNIYLGVNNTLQCVTAAGTKKWYFGYPTMDGAAAVAEDKTIYFAVTGDNGVGGLLGFSVEGKDISYTPLPGNIIASTTISTASTIYAGSGGTMVALKGNAPLAKSCWPKFRGNAAQTGRINSN